MMDGPAAERIEAMKIAYITQEVGLTPQEAQAFWPIYNQYSEELKKLQKARASDLMEARLNFNQLTDAQMETLVDRYVEHEVNEAEIRRRYLLQFKKVIPIRKVALLLRAEMSFKRVLLQRLRENSGGSNPGGRPGGGFHGGPSNHEHRMGRPGPGELPAVAPSPNPSGGSR
jgi:hypothetical protein